MAVTAQAVVQDLVHQALRTHLGDGYPAQVAADIAYTGVVNPGLQIRLCRLDSVDPHAFDLVAPHLIDARHPFQPQRATLPLQAEMETIVARQLAALGL
jgi:hypothetical protein